MGTAHGLRGLLQPSWEPPLPPPVVLLVLYVLACASTAWLLWVVTVKQSALGADVGTESTARGSVARHHNAARLGGFATSQLAGVRQVLGLRFVPSLLSPFSMITRLW